MKTQHSFAETFQKFDLGGGRSGRFYALPVLAHHYPQLARLPISLRIVLESVLRNCDGQKVTQEHVTKLASWQPNASRVNEIPFVISRVLLQDFTGIPLLADLAAMRHVTKSLGKNPKIIEPLVPVDLVVDHSVMADHVASKSALGLNMKLEFERNHERYAFMKWGMQAFDTFHVVPPGFGIVHQINLEYLARGVHKKSLNDESGDLYYPDTLVGTDSHTTMINGIGVVGWGVGGIEAEAGMLGQPVYFLEPDVVGFELRGGLREGVTATDLVLTITEQLRNHKVVGKFVEFFGEGARQLSVPDRATIGNMAPEYGATIGFFPVDERTLEYLRGTGRTEDEINAIEAYFKAQGMFGMPQAGEIDYSEVITLDLSSITPSVAGPKRPQDRIEVGQLQRTFESLLGQPTIPSGFNLTPDKLNQAIKTSNGLTLHHGDILIAAITSCTNTSNPSVMLAAGLLAKKAVEAGLTVPAHIKTSLAPGSRVVTSYLQKTKLLPYLEQLGFDVMAYGCTTCIGNSGDLAPELVEAITQSDLICAAVLSGNRNFEARIHPNIKANFLASPPLVVAFALAGTIRRNLLHEPIGVGSRGQDVYLKDIWPSSEEISDLMSHAMDPEVFKENYAHIQSDPGALWKNIEGVTGQVYSWPTSTYIARPPFLDGFALALPAAPQAIHGARAIALFGDSITTDHISPAGAIKEDSPAGRWLKEHQVKLGSFNSYGSRRGNHEVMVRGTFANVRIKNLLIPASANGTRTEGGYTLYQPRGQKGFFEDAQTNYQHEGNPTHVTTTSRVDATAARATNDEAQTKSKMSVFDAAMKYQAEATPTLVFAGEEYGTGSSRDWAAKGTQLLGIVAVIARSFERIHRSNLIGMGVLALQFQPGDSWESLGITGDETFDIELGQEIRPQGRVTLVIRPADKPPRKVLLTLRIDTAIEVAYYRHGGILPFVLRDLLSSRASEA